jgi:hypothetical protein
MFAIFFGGDLKGAAAIFQSKDATRLSEMGGDLTPELMRLDGRFQTGRDSLEAAIDEKVIGQVFKLGGIFADGGGDPRDIVAIEVNSVEAAEGFALGEVAAF